MFRINLAWIQRSTAKIMRMPRALLRGVSAVLLMWSCHALAVETSHKASDIHYRSVTVQGVRIFYREAGPRDAPTVLLLHGFPSSSFMFRNLIPLLARDFHVIAPDYPGFGQSDSPPRDQFSYTFERLSRVIEAFTEEVGLERFAMYIQDYGSPIGLRMALRHSGKITALIVQNGNAYEEGLSAGWDPLKAFWREPTAEHREGIRGWLTADGIRDQYVAGVPAAVAQRMSPDTWTLDWALLQRPGNIDIQLDLFADYQHNVELYPQIQKTLRTARYPTLIVWGRHDPFFTEAGAAAFRRDLPKAELHFFETGHFALETHYQEIGGLMREFLERNVREAR
jgi:pimeloyl-ACP methyl ester carboxylesterase